MSSLSSRIRSAAAGFIEPFPVARRQAAVTLIVESLARLRSRSCIIDGEAVCCGDDAEL